MPPERKKWEGDIHDDPKMVFARKYVREALEECPAQFEKTLRAKRRGIGSCGMFVTQVLVRDGHVCSVVRNRCQCRGCAVCDSLRAADLKRDLKRVVEERTGAGARFSMITLTIPHSIADDLQKLLDWLMDAVKRFQRSKAFKRHVRAWVRGIEVTWNGKNGFNPHVHYMVEADVWPKEEIKALWTRCMKAAGGPEVPAHGAHVMGLHDLGKGLAEVLGYPFKIHDLTKMPKGEVCRLLAVTKGRHLAQLCRKWSKRVAVLREEEEGADKAHDDLEGRVRLSPHELMAQANGGSRVAFDLLVEAAHVLQRNWATRELAMRMGQTLRAIIEEHGWPMPDLPKPGDALPWVES